MKGSIELARLICVEIAGERVPNDPDGDCYGSVEIAEILSAGYERLKAENEALKAENEALRLENNSANSELILQNNAREADKRKIKMFKDLISNGIRAKSYIDGEKTIADSSLSEKNAVILSGLNWSLAVEIFCKRDE